MTLEKYIEKLTEKRAQLVREQRQVEGQHAFISGRIQEVDEQLAEASKSDEPEATETPGAVEVAQTNGSASMDEA